MRYVFAGVGVEDAAREGPVKPAQVDPEGWDGGSGGALPDVLETGVAGWAIAPALSV